jgi:N-acetylglucosamine kinase-like BadF-type ATPase
MIADEEDTTVLDTYEVGETLSGALSIELVPTAMQKVLAPLDQSIGDSLYSDMPVYLWISAAGFSPWTRDEYLVAMTDILPSLVSGSIRSAGAANDGVSLLLGSRADGIVIAGTGSTVVVRSADGELHQAGGHGWVACDDGAGFWIGIRAIRQAYRDYECGLDSVLLQRLRQSYGIRAGDNRGLVEKLRDLSVGHKDMKKEIAHFAASVCAAERGDRPAQNIVKAEAEALADVTAEALRRRFSSSELSAGLRIVQCGSLLANELYRGSFETQLELRLLSGDRRKATFEWQRVVTAAEAAVRLAMDLAFSPQYLMRPDREFRPAIARV